VYNAILVVLISRSIAYNNIHLKKLLIGRINDKYFYTSKFYKGANQVPAVAVKLGLNYQTCLFSTCNKNG